MNHKMLKTIFLAAAALVCLPAVSFADGEGSAAAGIPQMSYEEFPRIDGSLACVPMIETLAKMVTGCTDIQAEAVLEDFTNTNPCYLQLAEGNRDILLVYEAAEETKEQLKKYDPLDIRELGKDALVFLVNENNPVQSLTIDQVYDIYTGKITNWSEVGGNDAEIKAFLRPETSGSQTLMRKLILGDAELVEGQIDVIPSMEGMIDELKEYENDSNALGYSVYYYASSMHNIPGVRLISVEGISPSNETISSGEYPLVNPFFVVTNEQSSEKALEIRDWLLTDEGQGFVEECGYVRAK
ncbi:MAG: substrate-binding domain-containing protein [Blautia sp.]|nr:substrate-binding domain-containing protein [Blautia sp.]